MILFTILMTVIILVVLFAIFVLGTGGAIATIIFSDLIVCVFLIALLMYFVSKLKRRK